MPTSRRTVKSRKTETSKRSNNQNDKETTIFKVESTAIYSAQASKNTASKTEQIEFIPVRVKEEPVDTGYEHYDFAEAFNNVKTEPAIIINEIVQQPTKNKENNITNRITVKDEPINQSGNFRGTTTSCRVLLTRLQLPVSSVNSCLNNVKIETENVVTLPQIKSEPRVKKRKHVSVKYEVDTVIAETTNLLGDRRLRSQMPKIKLEDKMVPKEEKWEPPDIFKAFEALHNIREMRKWRNAPVDVMGCEVWMYTDEPPKVARYQYLVALMLSSKTRDEVTYAAMSRLRAAGLTVDRVLAADEAELGTLVKPVTFWKTKVGYVKRATRLLRERWADDIPDSLAGLLGLPGVGPKAAHICMHVAWGEITGIGVGSFVHRVANRLGWAQCWQPERTQATLESWLPAAAWPELNVLLVGFAQQVCRARSPLCDVCLNATGGLCRASPF